MSKNKSKNKHCDHNNFKRARYFHGMLMTDRDFREEQIYHNEKRKLLNRMLHGWGVVCGLKVKSTDPASPCVVVEPGMALNCHGNEILLCQEQTIDLSEKICQSTLTRSQEDPCAEYRKIEKGPTTLYVVIKYHESKTDPVPVYAPGGSCEEKTCDYSRTQEGFCIEVMDEPPASPHLETLESGEACTEPFPCPNTKCCPDPHYILLATISCGSRKDGIFGMRVKNGNGSEIRYWVERTLDKVCIKKSSATKEDVIRVTDTYEFDVEDGIDCQSINWEVDLTKLQNEGLSVEPVKEEKRDLKLLLEYQVWTTQNAKTGLRDIGVPVKKLTYRDEQGNEIIWKDTDLPTLESPIEIGTADVRRGNTISVATIRNVEYRKFVASFQWFAWLSEVLGDEYYPWSGDVSVHCAVPEEEICATRRKNTIVGRINRRVAKVRKDLRKETEVRMAQLEKKNAASIKKVDTQYKKKLAEMNKAIKKLEEKVG